MIYQVITFTGDEVLLNAKLKEMIEIDLVSIIDVTKLYDNAYFIKYQVPIESKYFWENWFK
jgi:hypothetical protein